MMIHNLIRKYVVFECPLVNLLLFLSGWDGGTTITYAWRMTPCINFIGQKMVQSQALVAWGGLPRTKVLVARRFYARSFLTDVSDFEYFIFYFCWWYSETLDQ